MPVAEVNGQAINYTDSGGDGPAIIWSHGFLMDHTMFDAQVAAFSADHRCIAWDERGFGATPATGPFTYWDSADDAVALLDHLGVDQAVFAGMSQGGFLSLRAALAHPDRVRGLILIDTQAGTEAPENIEAYGGMLQHWLSDAPLGEIGQMVAGLILGHPDLAATWIPIWEKRRTEMTEHPGNCLLDRDDITDRLGEISCPALVIHGDEDPLVPLDGGRATARAIPNAKLVVAAGMGHELPRGLVPRLVEWIAEHTRAHDAPGG